LKKPTKTKIDKIGFRQAKGTTGANYGVHLETKNRKKSNKDYKQLVKERTKQDEDG